MKLIDKMIQNIEYSLPDNYIELLKDYRKFFININETYTLTISQELILSGNFEIKMVLFEINNHKVEKEYDYIIPKQKIFRNNMNLFSFIHEFLMTRIENVDVD